MSIPGTSRNSSGWIPNPVWRQLEIHTSDMGTRFRSIQNSLSFLVGTRFPGVEDMIFNRTDEKPDRNGVVMALPLRELLEELLEGSRKCEIPAEIACKRDFHTVAAYNHNPHCLTTLAQTFREKHCS